MTRAFGRIYRPDPRDYGHVMTPHLRTAEPLPAHRRWEIGPILDQGDKPWCVAYATENWLRAAPTETSDGPDVATIYAEAQKRDGIPMPHDGTMVRAAFAYMQELGRVGEYVWATDETEILHWVLLKGPVVLGTDWFTGMAEPDDSGLIHLTGRLEGGHAYLIFEADRDAGLLTFANSWGSSWGKHGTASMTIEQLHILLRLNGEAAAAVEQLPAAG